MSRFLKFGISFRCLASTTLIAGLSSSATAGIYSGPNDTTHAIDAAIAAGDAAFAEWADRIDASRTYFAPRGSSSIDESGGFNSLGDLDAIEIINGDSPGYLTVTFPTGIRNGDGADFAVFENGFAFGGENSLFAELAYVEVSSNGSDFVRFDSISTNTGPTAGSGAFAGYDMTNVYNLAGKHQSGYGTPFDLEELAGMASVLSGSVDLDNIQYVRMVDIPGTGDYLDSLGNPILDNWLTTGSGGFDFRLGEGLGVGVINTVPEPTSLAMLALAGVALTAGRRRYA